MRHTPLLSRWSIAQWFVALAVVLTHTPVGFAEILRKPGPPPVFTGPGGSAGGSGGSGGSSTGGSGGSSRGPFVRFETAEQQKWVFPTVQLDKGEGAAIVELDKARKKADLAQLLNMATDLPGMIKEEQAKGLTSFENEKKSIESAERANRHVPALSGSHAQAPEGFAVEPVAGFTDSGTPVPRNGYRDLSATAIASFQATNRSINTMSFSALMLSISQDQEVAAAVGVDVIVGGVIRPFFNLTAKVGDEMVRTVQCATQGMGVSTGCSTPTELQDYWGSLMTGEGQSYTAGAIALDAIGIGGGSAVAGLGADAAAAVLKKVPEGLEAIAKSLGRGAERIRTGYAATGFADETGAVLVREGERIGATVAKEAAAARRIVEVQQVIGHSKFNEIRAIPTGSRPPPESYLTADHISNHITSFDEGASYLVPKDVLDDRGRNLLGRPDGQFISTSSSIDKVLESAGGDIAILEKELGIDPGSWMGRAVVRIDIPNPRALNIRIPSGNEAGANRQWMPGGVLPNGELEAVVDQLPFGSFIENEVIKKP